MKANDITTFIVDDELASVQTLRNDLVSYPEIRVIGFATSPNKAIREIIRLQPDLLFVDIEMPEMRGIELVGQLQPSLHADVRVIFYTAYDQYLLEALRASAFDYLLKPYKPEELDFIINRLLSSPLKNAVNVEQSLRKLLAHDSKLAIQTVSGLLFIKQEEVLLFQFNREQRSWQLELTSRHRHKLRTNTTAKDLLAINTAFAQISQDCIVNLNHLASIENKTLECNFYPPFTDVEEVVSHRYYKKLKDQFNIL